jgi:hypothetical protein
VEGLTQALLQSAGYGHTAAVHCEHAGPLPSPFQGKPLWARGDVVMAAVRAPVGDRELRALPSGFDTSSGRVHITVITAAGPRVAVPPVVPHLASPVPPPAQQTPHQNTPGMGLARSLMRDQGWREGQPLGARDHQGAARVAPLDATADLGGRPPAVRTGLGFVRASGTSGDPTPPHPDPSPSPGSPSYSSPSPSTTPRPSPPTATTPQLCDGEDTDMPLAPPAAAAGPRPAVEEYMELEARVAEPPAQDPLVEGCALWLEEAYPRQSQEARRGLIATLHTACPAVWQTHRAGTGPPAPRVQRELRELAKRKGWDASSSSEDEPSDDALAGGPSGRRRRGGSEQPPVDAGFAVGPSGRRRRGGRDQVPGDAPLADGPSGRRQDVTPPEEPPLQPLQPERRPPSSRRRRSPSGLFSARWTPSAGGGARAPPTSSTASPRPGGHRGGGPS